MKIRKAAAFLFLTLIAGIALATPALAHRFNVALVIPLANGASIQGGQIRDGFMLATGERDSHPDQESDGHLGGLDVYVTVIDANGDVGAAIGPMAARGGVHIVAAFASETTLSMIGKFLAGKNIALLVPGQTPFANSGRPDVAAFIAAYQSKYGTTPSFRAAEGYHAARRINAAVRAQGGADDTASLLRSFSQTARDFTW